MTTIMPACGTHGELIGVASQGNIEIVHGRNHHGKRRESVGDADPEANSKAATEEEISDGVERQEWENDRCER